MVRVGKSYLFVCFLDVFTSFTSYHIWPQTSRKQGKGKQTNKKTQETTPVFLSSNKWTWAVLELDSCKLISKAITWGMFPIARQFGCYLNLLSVKYLDFLESNYNDMDWLALTWI